MRSALALIMLVLPGLNQAAIAQSNSVQAPDTVPFFDIARKPDRPDLTGLRSIRFITDDDYPPFHFPGPDGQLTGFNVDLARAICFELKLACTIQARRWETLIPSLEEGRGDAIIASMSESETARARVDFGIPYYRSPGRFIMRKGGPITTTDVADLAQKRVGVVANSAHAAFLTLFFPTIVQISAPDQNEALKLLVESKVDAVFDDGIRMALWLNGANGNCCSFVGGAFFESRYFGSGAAIVFRKDSAQLRRAVDFALFRLAETGVYQSLMLKYFPISFY